MKGGLMVCGTSSDAGKSVLVTGLCRLLARRGVAVAPFKAQNMSLNSYVTPSGHEIGRAQGVQALAAGLEPDVAMNPILLKPTSDTGSQVVLNGRPMADLTARQYHERQPRLLDAVLASLADLRARFDVVVAEGAGSPAEINLLDHDIVNLRVAHEAGLPALVVGDIHKGGVFAALYGTVALLPDHYRRLVRGFVINKFRGDPTLLGDGPAQLEARCGVPTLGVLPWVEGIGLDAEDSLALASWPPAESAGATGSGGGCARAVIDVAVVRLPHLANFTDFDPLALEAAARVRLAHDPGDVAGADLVVIPGTKATVRDLEWMRRRGFVAALEAARAAGATVLGVCGGYQMLGRVIHDDVESRAGTVPALGWLDVETEFGSEKVTARRRGRALGQPVTGYQIHHGRVVPDEGAGPWITLEGQRGGGGEGAASPDGGVLGTSLHGLFEEDGFRAAFLAGVAARRGVDFPGSSVSFSAARQDRFDRLADLIETHLDVERLLAIVDGS
ncbi:MAG TPA: cobyric acid synthase [Acidimicrobiales bacterium]|nr:cobyric acid synthase [Acidimicrobiales bacterium]